ncbi:MAG: LysM peptidoglycan-binding domain-containing protein [Rhizobiaceae bacterium]
MAIDPRNALLFAGGAVVAVAAVAYGVGAFHPTHHVLKQSEVAAPPSPPANTMSKNGRLAAKAPDSNGETGHTPNPEAGKAPAPNAASSNAPSADGAKPAQPAKSKIVTPSFDVVRVEGNGSVVVAGKAGSNAAVELLSGSHVIGAAKAGPEGDFAIVLDKPLKPGNYQLVLRATAPDKLVAMSKETAVVSVPEHSDGQVLALVETPGEPSKLITVPKPAPVKSGGGAIAVAKDAAKTPAPASSASGTVAASGGSTAPGQNDELASIAPQQEMAKHAQSGMAAKTPQVGVDAVEIEGNKIFIAGTAESGKIVRVYANDILLGEATASKVGRFLVEAMRELAVGDYIIRADMLDPEGRKVIARAAVPFQRQAGEAVAAVAPSPGSGNAKADAGGSTASPSGTVASAAPGQVKLPPLDNPIAKGPPTVLGAKLEEADGAVIIRRHDTLWQISRRVYGQGIRYSTIYLANQDEIQDPDLIYPGQVFRVPDKTKEGVAANMSAIGDQATTMAAKPAAQ